MHEHEPQHARPEPNILAPSPHAQGFATMADDLPELNKRPDRCGRGVRRTSSGATDVSTSADRSRSRRSRNGGRPRARWP